MTLVNKNVSREIVCFFKKIIFIRKNVEQSENERVKKVVEK